MQGADRPVGRSSAVDKGARFASMAPAGGNAGANEYASRASACLGLAACARFVCLGLDWETRSALPAMKVCLFSNPGLWTTGRHQKGPHRRCFKTSSDRRLAAEPTGLVSSRVPSRSPHHSRVGGRPQARATLGKRAYRERVSHNQLKIGPRIEFFPALNNSALSVSSR